MDNVSPALEYQSLREELLVAKKYVFERPLLILTLGAAILAGGSKEHLVFLPALLTGLLIFNLWFTVNRLRSAARIAAYIQLVLEEKAAQWIGWETALRKARIWEKRTPKDSREAAIDAELKYGAVPNALMFYPAIYRLHLVLLLMVLAGTLAGLISQQDIQARLSLGATLVLVGALALYLKQRPPEDLADLIERNRAMWWIVLEERTPKELE